MGAPLLPGLIAVFVISAPFLRPGAQLHYRDESRIFYPVLKVAADRIRALELPQWDPWHGAGRPLLADPTAGVAHPFSLLFVLPFDLAFKLRHLFALLIGLAGAFLLARRLGASPFAAGAAAAGFSASGYVASMAGSNVQYLLGACTLPLAIGGFLAASERATAARMLWASAALALCALSADYESAALAGALALALAVRSKRSALLWLLWIGMGIALAAPGLFPALQSLSARTGGVRVADRLDFRLLPARLPGLAIPWAFDDRDGPSGYAELFVSAPGSWADSVLIGMPLLICTSFAIRAGARARILLAGGFFLVAASLGTALPFEAVLRAVPPFNLFRYAEKLMGPATLLLCLAAALGLDGELQRGGTALRRIAFVIAFVAAGVAGLALAVDAPLSGWLRTQGRNGAVPGSAELLAASLRAGLFAEAALCALLAFAARNAAAVASVCALAGIVGAAGIPSTVPIETFRGPFPLATELHPPLRMTRDWIPEGEHIPIRDRAARTVLEMQSLLPNETSLAGVECLQTYTALRDPDYEHLFYLAPRAGASLFGARAVVRLPWALSAEKAAALGYRRSAQGSWFRELPEGPPAFLVGCATAVAQDLAAAKLIAQPGFEAHRDAVVRAALPLPPCPAGIPGNASYHRLSPERISVDAEPQAAALLVVAEHFDPGWHALVDGSEVPVMQADLAALGIPLAAGRHQILLWYRTPRLMLGACCALATLALAVAYALARARARQNPSLP
jgi:hypothetical protein